MASSRKGLTKTQDKPELIEIKGEILDGYVYIVDYVINGNINSKTPTSHARGYEDMLVYQLKKKFPKVRIKTILLKNPRMPSKTK